MYKIPTGSIVKYDMNGMLFYGTLIGYLEELNGDEVECLILPEKSSHKYYTIKSSRLYNEYHYKRTLHKLEYKGIVKKLSQIKTLDYNSEFKLNIWELMTPGNKIKFRKDLEIYGDYGMNLPLGNSRVAGKEVTIDEIRKEYYLKNGAIMPGSGDTEGGYFYSIALKEHPHLTFTDRMFETPLISLDKKDIVSTIVADINYMQNKMIEELAVPKDLMKTDSITIPLDYWTPITIDAETSKIGVTTIPCITAISNGPTITNKSQNESQVDTNLKLKIEKHKIKLNFKI